MALAWATGAVGQSSSSFGRMDWWPGYLRGDVKCVATAGRYAYLGTALVAGLGGCNSPAWCGRLEVMDVSDPARPVWVGGYDFRDPVQRIQVTSNYVYVASGITLNVLTVTNPAAPVLVGRWGSAPSDLGGWTFHLQGSYAYAMWRDTLDIFDVSNPAQLERVGGCPLGPLGCSGLRVAGNYAYIATFSGLRVVDVSMPNQPVLRAGEDGLVVYAIEVADGYAYLTTAAELRILSLANPAQPTLVGSHALGAGATALGILGKHLYLVASNRVEALDITDPVQPRPLGGCDTGDMNSDLALAPPYAFVAAGAAGLSVLDLNDPAKPAVLALGIREGGGPAEAVQVVGNYAYLADGNSGLRVIDLASTNGRVRVGQCQNAGYARAVRIIGNYAYVAAGSRANDHLWRAGLQIIDVSNPANLVSVGSLDLASDQPVNDLQVAGNLAYLVANDLVIVDVSTPAQPRKVGAWRTATPAQAVQVVGQWAYVTISGYQSESGSVDALMVIDVSAPAHPKRVGGMSTPSWAADLQVVGDRVYLANGPAGLMAVSLPIVPTLGLELSRGVSGLELRAQGAPGISCQLLRSSTLPGPWLPAESVTLTNTSQLLRTLIPAESSQFYRLLRK